LQRPGKEKASLVAKSDFVQIEMSPLTSRSLQISSMMKDSFEDYLQATGSKILFASQESILEYKNLGLHTTKLPVTEQESEPVELLHGHQDLLDLGSTWRRHDELRGRSIQCDHQDVCPSMIPVTELQSDPEVLLPCYQALVTRVHDLKRGRISQTIGEEVCTSELPVTELQSDPEEMLHSSAIGGMSLKSSRFQDWRIQDIVEEVCTSELAISELQGDPGHQALAVQPNSLDRPVQYSTWAHRVFPEFLPGDSIPTVHASSTLKRMSYSGLSLRDMQHANSFASDFRAESRRASQPGTKPRFKSIQVHPS
jgi:hypothetical protein